MGLYQSLAGQIRLRLIGGDIARTLCTITEQGIPVRDVVIISELEAELTVSRRFIRRLRKHVTKRGDRLTELGLYGTYWSIKNLMKRPVLIVGCLLLFAVALLASERILFVEVEGNEQIPSRQILETAKNYGICFGAGRRQVRSEVMKNHLLSQLPRLQWAGVNTYGCRAVITVRERPDTEEPEEKAGVSSIIAVRDGIVTSCTVTEGTAFCVPGQAVVRGQVLISGYSDRGLSISATHARGEVLAVTRRGFSAVTPKRKMLRTQMEGARSKYSLVIGKKRINFYKGSGISGAGCVKMYSEYVLSLPGGFSLPVYVLKTTITDFGFQESEVDNDTAAAQLTSFSEKMLKQSMVSGSITDSSVAVTAAPDCYLLEGWYACTEMIGGRQEEMIGEYNGKSDGTDRERGSGG